MQPRESREKHKDLMDAMLRHQQLERQHSMELITEMYHLIEEEERINRVIVFTFGPYRGKEGDILNVSM